MAKWERKNKVDNNMQTLWEYYKKNYNNPVEKKVYTKVCYTFNKMVSDAIVKESFEFKMPFKLGKLRIRTLKQKIHFDGNKLDYKKMYVDWKASQDLWRETYPELSWDKGWNVISDELKAIPDKKLIVHVNDHSNGYFNRWYWDKRLTNIKNQTAYSFSPVKGGVSKDGYYLGRRGLAQWTKDDERTNEYFE